MAPKKWSTPDYANTGKFVLYSSSSPAMRKNLRDDVMEESTNGWDLVKVDSLQGEMLVTYAKRDSRDQTFWDYQINGERGLEASFQESTLNCLYQDWELVTVWCLANDNVAFYCWRSPFPHSNMKQLWEKKVVERPVTDLQTLFASLTPLKKQGWIYKAHLQVTEAGQPSRHGFFLVYLQKQKTKRSDPDLNHTD